MTSTARSRASPRARRMLAEINADADVVEVDLRTAECQLAAGDHRAARGTIDATLRRDAALGGVIDHAPLLRVLACVLVADDDLALAETTIRASLDEALERDALLRDRARAGRARRDRVTYRPCRRSGRACRGGACALPRPRRGHRRSGAGELGLPAPEPRVARDQQDLELDVTAATPGALVDARVRVGEVDARVAAIRDLDGRAPDLLLHVEIRVRRRGRRRSCPRRS